MKEKMCKSLWFQLLLISVMTIFAYNTSVRAEDAEDWMPDPALREAVRSKLNIPDSIPMLIPDMLRLYALVSIDEGIRSLEGLQHAKNLKFLHVGKGQISDLTPLSGLLNLHTLKLEVHQIVDISPLSKLKNLRELRLEGNSISDLTPLSGLLNLEIIALHNNQIVDISPLSKLKNLRELRLEGNSISDLTPLSGLLNLKYLRIDRNPLVVDPNLLKELSNKFPNFPICRLEKPPYQLSVTERIQNRDFPSVFKSQAPLLNQSNLPKEDQLALHDFSFGLFPFSPAETNLRWDLTPWRSALRVGEVLKAQKQHERLIEKNPNMLFLVNIFYYAADPNEFPEDWPHWVREANGNRLKRNWASGANGSHHDDFDDTWEYWVDFIHPEVIDMIVQQAIAVYECGLYDGIWLDHWHEDGQKLRGYRTLEEELRARDTILQLIRAEVDDNFLILVNSNRSKIPRSASYVNGSYMELGRTLEQGYTYSELSNIETTLSWHEKNLREPHINLLEGEAPRFKPLDSPINKKWMRVFTTMSLTHSDGYVVYKNFDGFYWYDFWDAPLGRPIGGDETKAQLYENREGVFIQEFTNGWAVYNRSGTAQEIELPQEVSGWASGVEHQRRHTLADLDGEIYLKAETLPTADVNGDGVVNIQDLVIVANAFGEAAPDLNADGVVNIQDLVIVANAF